MNNASPLIEAISQDNLEDVTKLLATALDVNAWDDFGALPLASINWNKPNAFRIADLLLDAGADINRLQEYYGTALSQAVKSDNADAVQYLIDKGASANIRIYDNTYDFSTALHSAAGNCTNPRIIEILVENGADPNAPGLMGHTPLHDAVTSSKKMFSDKFFDKSAVVEALLNGGADANRRDDRGNRGNTPLLAMASKNPLPELAALLMTKNIDMNARNREGETALHIAAKYGYVEFVDFLLKNGANPVALNRYGESPRRAMIAFNARATRDPDGITNALKKIIEVTSSHTAQGYDYNAIESLLKDAEAEATSIPKISSAIKKIFGR